MLLIFKSGAYGLHLFDRIMDWGAVLEVLWITATQALHAINLWLCTLC